MASTKIFFGTECESLTTALLPSNVADDPNTVRLKVRGMHCEHCVRYVTEALRGVEGVADVAVSLEGKSAVVRLSHSVPKKILVEAIQKAGFKAS